MTDDIAQPIPLFAFPLFAGILAGHDERREALVAEILEHRARFPGGLRRSNRGGWHSGKEFLGSRSAELTWVLHHVTRFAGRVLGRYHGQWATRELRLGSYWANVLDAGGWHAPHHHLPHEWSGVYYVDVGTVGVAPDDLRGRIEFVNPNPNQSAFGGGNFGYSPSNGLVLLFPSSLLHLVHPHDGEVPRISVAFNFNVVPSRG